MTPKEKAKELIKKYIECEPMQDYGGMDSELAKFCSIITCEEILSMKIVRKDDLTDEYWERVKEEINKL